MATIKYTCNNCKRSVEYVENINGITHIGQCSITKNCNGTLYKIERNPNNVRTTLPITHDEMDDYMPRNLFFHYKNLIPTSKWIIKHNLGKSCVLIVYGVNGEIINSSDFSFTNDGSIITINFDTETGGEAHILSRNDSSQIKLQKNQIPNTQISTNGYLTFATPQYINSGANIIDVCQNNIKIDIEVTRPNETSIFCSETLIPNALQSNPWYGWNKVLIRNRKHYCLHLLDLNKLKALTPLYDVVSDIPDGTVMKIIKISYDGVNYQNIPDKGLLILLSKDPYRYADKILDKFIDCGEIVDSYFPSFTFYDKELFSVEENIENTYPEIKRHN